MQMYVKKLCCLILAICILITTTFTLTALVYTSTYLISSGKYCYYIEEIDGGIILRSVYPTENEMFISLQNDFLSAQIVGDFIYIICATHNEYNSLEIGMYSLDGRALNSLVINTAPGYEERAICIAPENKVYYCDPENSNNVLCIDFFGNLIKSIAFPEPVRRIYYEKNGELLVSSEDRVFITYENTLTSYNINGPLISIGASYYLGLNGGLYLYSNGLTDTGINDYPHSTIASADNDSIYIVDGKRILLFSGGKRYQYTSASYITDICTVGGRLFVLNSGSPFYSLDDEDFTLIPDNNNDDPYEPSGSEETDNTDPEKEYTIDSDIYMIDIEDSYILKVPPSTSVTSFKKNISHTFDAINLLKNGFNFSNGKIFTGLVARFSSGNDFIDFSVIVYGDLNSNGECNNSDKKLLIAHLLEEKELDGLSLISADMNFDGKVNLSDLLLLYRKTKNN